MAVLTLLYILLSGLICSMKGCVKSKVPHAVPVKHCIPSLSLQNLKLQEEGNPGAA